MPANKKPAKKIPKKKARRRVMAEEREEDQQQREGEAEEREEDQQQREGEGENEGNPHDESNDATEGEPGALTPHPGDEPEPENPEPEPEPAEPLTQDQQFLLFLAAIIFSKSNLHLLADAYTNAKNLVQLLRDDEAAKAEKEAA
jgi:hypothetical protein